MIDDAFDNVRNYVDNFLAHAANATIILLDFIFAIVERSEVAVVLLYIPVSYTHLTLPTIYSV